MPRSSKCILFALVALFAIACGPAQEITDSSSEELAVGVYVSKATNINNGGYIGDWEHEWGYVLGYMGPGARIYAKTVRAGSVYGLITNSHYGAWDHGHHCGWVSLKHLKGSGFHSSVADICPPPDNDFSLAPHSGGPTGFRKGSWTECDGCVQRAVVLPTCSDFTVYANYDPVTHTFHDPDGVEVATRGTIDGKGSYGVSGVKVTQGYSGFGTRFVTSDGVAVEIKDTRRLCNLKGGCTAFGFMHADCIGGELVGSPAGKGPGTPPPPSCGAMFPSERLNAGQSLASCDSTHTLTMQPDGNLVLYDGQTAILVDGHLGDGRVRARLPARRKPRALRRRGSTAVGVAHERPRRDVPRRADRWKPGRLRGHAAALGDGNEGPMKTTIAVAVSAALLALACSSPQDSCAASAGLVLHDGDVAYDALVVQGGFVYLEVPGAGIQRCPTSGCLATTSVVDSPAFVSSALGGDVVTYTTQIAADDGSPAGELRAVNADGTSDRVVDSPLPYPAFTVVAGARTFWAQDSFAFDDTPATVHCIGCGADPSAAWISGLGGGTYGMMVDATDVYVLADDPSLQSVTLYACSIDTPCTQPRVVLAQLDKTITSQQIESDGAYVYVARAQQSDVVRVDRNGVVSTVVDQQTATAIAIDAGSLYFGTDTGTVARTLADGSTTLSSVACGTDPIAALAVDGESVYFLTGPGGSSLQKASR